MNTYRFVPSGKTAITIPTSFGPIKVELPYATKTMAAITDTGTSGIKIVLNVTPAEDEPDEPIIKQSE